MGRISNDDELDELRVEEERNAVMFVRDAIQRRTLPPVGLGSARTSLSHEAHAFYHALYLEAGSMQTLVSMVQGITSLSTDKAAPSWWEI